ncbi:MAG: glycine--tRNA ligase subunit beta [Bryobacterales bacterium]|nr:glycine--tRNA ligase subunit beta [Bryobacterales bacterium]
MSDLLLEVGTEEIPARLIPGARRDLERTFRDALKAADIHEGARVAVEATPRRLALIAENLPERQADRTLTFSGPTRQVAFDADGNPTRAALGFARKAGVPVEALEFGPDGKLRADRTISGRPTDELLAESLPAVVLGVRFPRSMYWTGRNGPKFIRPIRWLVALLDGEAIRFEVGGVTSGILTWGHRRLSSGPLAVSGPEDYRMVLRDNAVLLSAEERGRKIETESKALLPPGHRIRANARLLETLVNETELPTAVLGTFDPDYLSLPEEVLETVMLVHQKYFVVENDAGKMTNSFVAVANTRNDESGEIRRGHERVLRARFNDARFFWQFDQRTSLAERVAELRDVTFQASIGSYWDKTQSNLNAAADLSESLGLDDGTARAAMRAVELAKCDLTTEMVGEFPELQGKIGGLYAAAQSESGDVADAIYDHYLPVGASGPIPRSAAGRVASMADKLSTLGGMFGLGLIPTGSKDPLALRRAAFAVIRIVIEGGLPLDLDRLVEVSGARSHADQLRGFLLDRLRHWLQDSGGFSQDVVQAVLAASDRVPVDALARAKALANVRATPDFEALAVSFKRIRNILEHAGGAGRAHGEEPDTALLDPGAETGLHEAVESVAGKVAAANANRDYTTSLREIAELRPALDRYFDDVLVMADDEAVRRNRLTFLARLLDKLSTIADFAVIAPESAGKRR